MLIALTGATGHVGANLVRALLAGPSRKGPPVRIRALVREDARALDGLEVERVPGDLLDRASLQRVFEGADLVFHLAARISIENRDAERVEHVNLAGTSNVVSVCLASGVGRLIHFSSIHALSPRPAGAPVDESRPLNDNGAAPPYDRSKAAAEKEVLAGIGRGLDAVIVSPTAVIGPYDFKPSEMGSVLLDLHHRRLPALVAGGFDWVDARDVASGAIAAAARGRRGERYLLSGKWLSIRDLAGIVEKIAGRRAPRWVVPMTLARAAVPFAAGWTRLVGGRPRFTRASLRALREHRNVVCEKAKSELGWTPRPLEETIADTFDWFRETGAL